ncbi:pyridoxamine 5'-phosphate oxidase family protein [Luteibacter yeojuensis]|uniref:Pyridoxamine 5'-phosphate oxidase n=1 Tax=Luteibacter yeojuensis TaxID=345309 RepID=A0A0F3K5L9_9GAMM|nr:pyridoxamine 5'-phosphate oxidase family protein [Luteibacter yeojuensis]KJV26277.1 pyridoxamine 5'-phosphate oxidase [Luteibacter yeojuensis]
MNGKHPFHDGERAVQARAGETATADRHLAMVGDEVIGGARPFIASQGMVALGNTDAAGRPWASLMFGAPGFAHTADGQFITVDMPASRRDATDPLWAGIRPGADLGMLFIELGTRRRYRVNGTVVRDDGAGIEVMVREAYPNCPKYIQRRVLRTLCHGGADAQSAAGTAFAGSVDGIIRAADTLFIATRHAEAGADVSHRGGEAGFIQRIDAHTLRIPDYPGNSLFNTWGNLAVDPHAGLCIPDFTHGRLLQLTGTATLLFDEEDAAGATGGTRRFITFHLTEWTLRDAMPRAEWTYLDASPFNPPANP